ncbi:hypothetical protein K144313037_p20370 (plasmid) [Clostridium tetani]|uniref:helix-turn-helix domain-containing protein n=1 Tax=Clostridium tetani TaxID=1513 RepID=UPI001FB0B948|nr:helix-turn-helix transcriptional regulator [Clostridium tetani]BDR71250.1 hypothetical protein K144313037_p20370 [Clostridium tetani]BEV19051.1 helix-turn-helix transcriptional regulator [Clostridium tetani]
MKIGSTLKKLRKDSKLTQKALADKCNMSRGYLADLEADRYNPSISTLKTISDVLGVSINEFFDGKSAKKENIETLDVSEHPRLSKEEEKLISNFNKLNETGKDEAIKRVEELTQIDKYTHEEKDHLMPIAAHDKEGKFSKEDMEHDLNLMKDDKLWK